MAKRRSWSLWVVPDAKVGGVCGVLTGILLIATYGAATGLPFEASQADQTLANFGALRTGFLIGNGLIALAAVFAVPYFASMRTALKGRSALLATAAAVFSTAGIILLAVQFLAETIALGVLADVYAAGGPSRNTAVTLAQVVIGLTGLFLFGFGLLMAGVGTYGYLMVKSGTFPDLVGYIGILAAVLALVGSVPALGFVLFIVAFVVIFLWFIATSAILFRSATKGSAAKG